uniref:Putative procollagen c-endopeptidase enhancer n=1 Tax=Ixodes scapularis TaxID=6945 RepID=A0A4D5RYK6_IXOSC
MRLTLILLILFPTEYATWYSDHVPFKCGGIVKIPSIFVCDGKRQCPNDTAQSFYADDEDYEMCVATQYLPSKDLVLTTQSDNNLTVLISWSFEDSAIKKPDVELTSENEDSENVHLAGYLFSGTSDPHNFKMSFPAQVNEYHVSGLRPWTLYEIVLRPYYTFDGSLQPIYKVGKAAYTIYQSEATAPTAPVYAEVLSVEDKKILMKVGDPLRWNGEPGGYLVRWETLDSLPERRGQAFFGIPETRSLETVHMTISVDLAPGRHYGLHTSVQNFGHENKSLVGPEVSTSAVVPCTDPVNLTAIATGPHEVTVTWRSESFAEYFEISVLAMDASQTDKKEQREPDDDEAVQSNNTILSPQDVLINVTAKQDAASVYNITLHKPISYSNVSVRVKSCGMEKCTPGIVTPIFTQSDCPPFFEVLNVNMTAFEVRLTPKRYTQYQVRYCNKDGVCKTIFTPGSVSIVALMPGTTYTVNVREGLIDANRQVILGPAARTRVSTVRDVATRYLSPKELVLTTQSENNLTVLVSWSLEDSAITKSGVELTSESDDNENVHLAGYLFSGTSDHHNLRKTFTAQVNEYRVSHLKPWTLYEIVLQPYYTFDGSLQPIYKVGKATYTIYHSEATPPTAPAYAEVLSVEDKKISMKVGDPLSWNGEPGGYLVRWETLDSLPERRGQAFFGIPETRSLETVHMTISVDLAPGRHYGLHTSVQNFGHENKSLVGPEVSTSAVTLQR